MVNGGKIKIFLTIFVVLIIGALIVGCPKNSDKKSERYSNQLIEILEKLNSHVESLEKDRLIFDGSRESANKLLPKFKTAREDFIDAKDKVTETKPPEENKDFHNKLIKLLDRGINLYGFYVDMSEFVIKSNLNFEGHIEDGEAFEMAFNNASGNEQKVSLTKTYQAEVENTLDIITNINTPKNFKNLKDKQRKYFKSLIKVIESQVALLQEGKSSNTIMVIKDESAKMSHEQLIQENMKIIDKRKSDVKTLIKDWNANQQELKEIGK